MIHFFSIFSSSFSSILIFGRIGAGSLQALVTFLILKLYDYVVDRLVEWENHPYINSKIRSSNIKKVFFHLIANYVVLVMMIFTDKPFNDISVLFSTIYITTSLLHLITVSQK